MKKWFPLTFAGFVGGLVAIAAIQFTDINNKELSGYNQSPHAIFANSISESAPNDFVVASRKVTPAVVHISASESTALTQQRIEKERGNRPDGDIFNLWGFEEFFGNGYFQPREGSGSGVIVSEDGYIVTNNHVVEYADIIYVTLADKREFNATKIGVHPGTDLALLKIEATDLNSVSFADSDKVEVGEWTLAIGNPFSYLTSTVTAGIVSAKGRELNIIKGEKAIESFIQTDAAINPGNSGGALVNTNGELIGINTAIATPNGVFAGYSFAIPSNLVQRVIDDIKEAGNYERGHLGIRGNTVDNEFAKEVNIDVTKGFYVATVDKGSAAQLAGVISGDIIVGINGQVVDDFDDLYKEMAFAKVGDTIYLELLRKDKKINIPVKLRKGI